jgi:hypothetical protein
MLSVPRRHHHTIPTKRIDGTQTQNNSRPNTGSAFSAMLSDETAPPLIGRHGKKNRRDDTGMKNPTPASMGDPVIVGKPMKTPQPVDVRDRRTHPGTNPVSLWNGVGQNGRSGGEAGHDVREGRGHS